RSAEHVEVRRSDCGRRGERSLLRHLNAQIYSLASSGDAGVLFFRPLRGVEAGLPGGAKYASLKTLSISKPRMLSRKRWVERPARISAFTSSNASVRLLV